MADLRSLTVLAAVVRHGSFTAAGHELHVAQQAVSRTVARLEAELGVALLERHPHGAVATAAGASLAQDAERLAADAEAAVARARELGGATAVALRLGISPSLSAPEVARAQELVAAALPGVQLDLLESRPRAIPGQLRSGAASLVLARFTAPSPGRRVVAVGTTPAGVAVPDRHRLARRRRPVTLDDLAGEDVLVWAQASAATRWQEELLAHVAVRSRPSSVVGRDGLADVARGRAVALWPVEDREPRAGVCVVALDPAPQLPVVAVARIGRPAAEVRRALDALTAGWPR